jgi:U3 small nucleolar RNA-associated protein 20
MIQYVTRRWVSFDFRDIVENQCLPPDEIKTMSIELQDLVRNKVGVVKFSNVYSQVRQGIVNVRRERKATRALQAANNPEAAAKRKIRQNLTKKISRKRKDRGFA